MIRHYEKFRYENFRNINNYESLQIRKHSTRRVFPRSSH